MGSQIGTSAFGMLGNVLGGFIGGPIGSMIGGMAGGIIGSLLFSRKSKPLVPDVQLMNSAYGKPIPIVWAPCGCRRT
jgi:outer membrane lipoprotein SlyB